MYHSTSSNIAEHFSDYIIFHDFFSNILQQQFSQNAILRVPQQGFEEKIMSGTVASVFFRYQTGQFAFMGHAKVQNA
jgi:hypothetical protein